MMRVYIKNKQIDLFSLPDIISFDQSIEPEMQSLLCISDSTKQLKVFHS